MTMHRLLAYSLLGAALAAASTPAFAGNDAVQFGSNIHVARDTAVHDAVCFFCSVKVDGEVQGDVVVFFGNIHLAGNADHDVVSFFGKVTAEDGVSIGQDLVSFFGGIRLGKNVSVGKDMVAIFGVVHAPDSVTVGKDRVVQPYWIFFGPMILVGLVVILVVREFRAHRRRVLLGGYPLPPNQ
jgi:hypothetical protein